jgi:hypothetical protein
LWPFFVPTDAAGFEKEALCWWQCNRFNNHWWPFTSGYHTLKLKNEDTIPV